MARQGKRHTLALGIYEDATGYEGQVNGGRGPGNSKRFHKTEDREADVRAIKRWQLRRETLNAQQPADATARPDTLRADVPVYLKTLTDRARRDAETLLDHWLATPLANLARHEITPVLLRIEIAAWLEAGVAASTINHRVSKLRALYNTLDEHDLDAPNPTLKITKIAEPDPQPREIPRAFVEAIFAAMPNRGRPTKDERRPTISKTKLRLRVIATTGLPHKQVGRIRPEHVDWRNRAIYVTPRRKGKGTKGKWLPLTHEAVKALREFFDKGADGPFSPSAAAKTWHRAVARVKADYEEKGRELPALPPKLKPYDLRHTFLTVVFRKSRNPRAVQELGLHSDPRTADRYRVGAVEETTRVAVNQVNRWHRSAGTGKTRKNANKRR